MLISPTLAATIGLEQAVLLHVVSELLLQHPPLYRDKRRWGEIAQATLERAMPFWGPQDIARIKQNLCAQGLLLVEAGKGSNWLLAINQPDETEAASSNEPSLAPVASTGNSRATLRPVSTSGTTHTAEAASGPFDPASGGRMSVIAPNWKPSEDLYLQCEQHGIPPEFVAERVRGFVMYWRERQKPQYSWHNTFLKQILREWRQQQSYQGAKEMETEMTPAWRPDEDAVAILENAGVNHSFIEDAVAEFVLYWRERGLVTSTWNSKFIAHIRRQWAKYTQAVSDDAFPRTIPPDFEPSDACYEVLAMANIDLEFARQQIPEFVLYWRDNRQACASWNTRFLQHVKFKWARQHLENLPLAQQMESTIGRLTDRSWAD